jgi:type IV secretion system protein VirB10
MADPRERDDIVPFDENDEIYDPEYAVPEENIDTLEKVRGESELSKQKRFKKKGQKALLFFLILGAVMIASAMTYRAITAEDRIGEGASVDETKKDFVRPDNRSFGAAFAEDEVPDYDPYAVENDPNALNNPVPGSTSGIYEDTSGLSGTSSAPPNYAPIEPPISEPVQTQQSPPMAFSPSSDRDDYAEPVAIPEPVKTPEELRKERLYRTGFTLPKNDGGNDNSNSDGNSGFSGNRSDKTENQDPLVKSLSPASLTGSSAVRMKNRDLIITKGNVIDCVLETKLNSTVMGMLSCTVTRNVYGASGRVVLIDRGSKVTGEYKGGLEQGQNRLFVLWNRIETPKGVIIDINSLAAGALGQAGVAGRVDTKFWKRFGGAMLVSLVSDLGKAASERVTKEATGDTIRLENTTAGAQDLATAALEQSINIPPSLVKHQGDRLSIFVARDIWFGDVYSLKPKK